MSGAYWHVEGFTIRGGCAEDDACEHALHIVGAADGTEVRGNTPVDFKAQIKGNGEDVDGVLVWPDDVVIEGNDLHDTRPRQTANPVTKIDVVGGRRWRIEANRSADFEKALGDTVSYAAFLLWNSKDGLMARNLVACSDTFAGGVRVGPSLGGRRHKPEHPLRGRHLHAGTRARHASKLRDCRVQRRWGVPQRGAGQRGDRQHVVRDVRHRRAVSGEHGDSGEQRARRADSGARRRGGHVGRERGGDFLRGCVRGPRRARLHAPRGSRAGRRS